MNKYNEYFIDIKLSPETVYLYSARKLLQKAIDQSVHLFNGTLLDLGCGEMPYRPYLLDKNKKITKYIGMDVDTKKYNMIYHRTVKPDLLWDGKKIDLSDNSIDTVIATELFEHIENLNEVLSEVFRVLKNGGIIFFSVPFIWPLHEVPYDQYRYTPYSLNNVLEKAWFRGIEIFPFGGYNAALAQMLCIWIYNRKNELASRSKKKVFERIEKHILYPIIEKLLKKDSKLNITTYGENTMPTGFYGHAKK
jgi:ubiquinone/menaquinone biosynthesis C-methylase UbiE